MINVTLFLFEAFMILILLILIFDYRTNHQKTYNKNYPLYLGTLFSVLGLCIVDLLLNFSINTNWFLYIITVCGYILILFPPLLIYNYINTKFVRISLSNKKIVKNFTIATMIIYSIFIIIFFINKTLYYNEPSLILSLKDYNYILFISLAPVLYTLFVSIFYKKNIDRDINTKIQLFSIIIILGTVLSFHITIFPIYTATYILIILLLHLYRQSVALNMDSMTSLYNRRIFQNMLFDRVLKKSKFCAVYYYDLDDLKIINDSYGHKSGDKALIDFAAILKKSVRKNDHVIRLGGDEFLIVASLKAKEDLNMIPNRVDKYTNSYNLKNTVKINASLGYDFYEDRKISFDLFLASIDKKMYENKYMKKNGLKKGIEIENQKQVANESILT